MFTRRRRAGHDGCLNNGTGQSCIVVGLVHDRRATHAAATGARPLRTLFLHVRWLGWADQSSLCQPFVVGDLPSGGNAQARMTPASGETTRLKAK